MWYIAVIIVAWLTFMLLYFGYIIKESAREADERMWWDP
jgi:hypothetical protein